MNLSSSAWLDSLYADTLIEVIAKSTGVVLEILPDDPAEQFGQITGVMHLEGKSGGTIFISAREDDIRMLCSFMIGVPKNRVTREDMEDALCEFVNMTAGNVKVRLGNSEYSFTLSLPFVISGERMTLTTKNRERVIAINLGNEEISLKLKILCSNSY